MTSRPEDGEQTDQRKTASRQGLAYQGSLEAVIAILIAVGIGYWIDSRYETSPWGVLIGAGVGFGSFVLRLLQMARRLQELDDPAIRNDEEQ